MAYRWSCAHEWLEEHVARLNDRVLLRVIIRELAIKHDHDTLQDLYERQMDLDGFWEEEHE